MAFRDIKSYGEHPFASNGRRPSYPMISPGKEIKSMITINDNRIKCLVVESTLIVYKTLRRPKIRIVTAKGPIPAD
jgi:hypothetical protein